jgi:hypothetical protein
MLMALYTRTDGLLEPRNTRAWEWVQKQPAGALVLANITADRRNSLQNRYLNGWVYKWAVQGLSEAGHSIHGQPWTRDRFHAAMQACFLVVDEFELNGQAHHVYESTGDMSRKRFAEYCDQVKAFVYDAWGVVIPEPEDDFYRELLREINREAA